MVASAAPVIIFVAPGPIDEVQAKVRSRLLALANPAAMCTPACSLRTRMYGKSGFCCNACPIPATLPCPKIPSMPAKNACSRPSRSTYCCFRNRINACAIVMRRVFIATPPTPRLSFHFFTHFTHSLLYPRADH